MLLPVAVPGVFLGIRVNTKDFCKPRQNSYDFSKNNINFDKMNTILAKWIPSCKFLEPPLAPTTKIIYITNYPKDSIKKLVCTSRQSMCVRTVSQKRNNFCGRCKKDKHVLWKALFLAPKFILFTQLKRQVDFFIGFCAHVACENVHMNISFEILNISNNVKDIFQNKGAYAPQVPKHHVPYYTSIGLQLVFSKNVIKLYTVWRLWKKSMCFRRRGGSIICGMVVKRKITDRLNGSAKRQRSRSSAQWPVAECWPGRASKAQSCPGNAKPVVKSLITVVMSMDSCSHGAQDDPCDPRFPSMKNPFGLVVPCTASCEAGPVWIVYQQCSSGGFPGKCSTSSKGACQVHYVRGKSSERVYYGRDW
jgi:hypothetical protein